ncbi:MAG: ribbon-helix-helix protein, CopG family [Candidatus Aminicenantales bacterium]
MAKTVKFSISMPAPEFKALEVARRKAGRTRSQFIRETILKAHDGQTAGAEAFSVGEDRSAYGSLHPADMTDMAELRQRAIAAAGRFESGVPDISIEHDRYLTDPEAGSKGGSPGRAGKDGGTR